MLLGGISVFGGRGTLTGVLLGAGPGRHHPQRAGLNQIGGDAQGMVIGLLLIGSLLVSNSTGAPRQRAAQQIARHARDQAGDLRARFHLKPEYFNGGVTMKAFRLALLRVRGSARADLAGVSQECAKEPVTVGFLPKLDTDPYFQVAKSGAEEAAKEIGGNVIQEAPSQATAEAQIEFINNLVVAEGRRHRHRRQRRQCRGAGAEARRRSRASG